MHGSCDGTDDRRLQLAPLFALVPARAAAVRVATLDHLSQRSNTSFACRVYKGSYSWVCMCIYIYIYFFLHTMTYMPTLQWGLSRTHIRSQFVVLQQLRRFCRAISSQAGRMASQSSGSKSGNPLSHLGRKVFTTQRALAQILKQIRELDELPAATGRSAVKRAREQQLHDYDTPYGPIYIEPTLQKEDGFDVTIPSLSPAAMLHWACQHCAAFGQFLEKQMVLNPPTFAKNWTLAWYSDEVAPGNQLKHVNRRKVQVIYWSLKQLGSHAMTCGSCWFTLTVVRSTVVADMGGWRFCSAS